MRLDDYTDFEVQLLVWACAYEHYDTPVTTDALFDGAAYTYAKEVPKSKRGIKDFEPYTGQWVTALETPELLELTEKVIEVAADIGWITVQDSCGVPFEVPPMLFEEEIRKIRESLEMRS